MCNILKTRSNVAASILLNGDVLEQVYAKASNAQGSAQEELNKYLDSISAKMVSFQNQIQEFWTGLISSDFIKFFVELGTQLIKIVNSVGQMKTLFVAIVSILSVKKLGLFSTVMDSHGVRQFTIMNTKLSDFKKNLQEIQAVGNKSKLGAFFSMLGFGGSKYTVSDSLLTQYEAIREKAEGFMLNGEANSFVAMSKATKELGFNMGDITEVMDNFIDSEKKGIVTSDQLRESFTKVSGTQRAFLSLGNVVKSVMANIAVAGATAFAGWLISSAIKGISDWIHSAERLHEEVKQVREEYNNLSTTINNNRKTVNEIKDRFNELSKKVDIAGNNIGLTNDEFSEYHDLTNKIADMFPNMVKGFDDQGNAILNLTGKVNNLNDALDDEQKKADNLLISNSAKIEGDYKNNQLNGYESTVLYSQGISADEALMFVNDLMTYYHNTSNKFGDSTYENRDVVNMIYGFINQHDIEADVSDVLFSLLKAVFEDAIPQGFQAILGDESGFIDYEKFSMLLFDKAFNNSLSIMNGTVNKYRDIVSENASGMISLILALYEQELNNIADNPLYEPLFNNNDISNIILEGIFTNLTDADFVDLYARGLHADTFVHTIVAAVDALIGGNDSQSITDAFSRLFNGAFIDVQGNISDEYSSDEAYATMKELYDIIMNGSFFTSDLITEENKEFIRQYIDNLFDFYGKSVIDAAHNTKREILMGAAEDNNGRISLFDLFNPPEDTDYVEDQFNELFKKFSINTENELLDFYSQMSQIYDDHKDDINNGLFSIIDALDIWEQQYVERVQGEPISLSNFLQDENNKTKLDSFVKDMDTLGDAYRNWSSLTAGDKINLYNQFQPLFPEIIKDGELTQVMLQQIASAEWDGVNAMFAGVENAENLLDLYEQYYKEAMKFYSFDSEFEDSVSKFVPNSDPVVIKSRRDSSDALYLGNKDAYDQFYEIQDMTSRMTKFQQFMWTRAARGTEDANEALTKYHNNLTNSFISLEDLPPLGSNFLDDKYISSYVDEYQSSIGLIEKGIKDVSSLTNSERITLEQMFPWLITDGINETSLTLIKTQFEQMITIIGAHVDGFSEYMEQVYNEAVNTEKSIAQRYKESFGNFGMSESIPKSMRDKMVGLVNSGYNPGGVNPSNIIKNSHFDTFIDLIEDETFSGLLDEYEELFSMTLDGISPEEAQSFAEAYDLTPTITNIETVMRRAYNMITQYLTDTLDKDEQVVANAWLEQFLKGLEKSTTTKKTRDALLKRIQTNAPDMSNSLYSWINSLTDEDLAFVATIDLDNKSLEDVQSELDLLKSRLDTEGFFNFTISDEKGQSTTLGGYMDRIKSEAESVREVVDSLVLGKSTWEDIEKDSELYLKLDKILPGLSAHMEKYSGTNEATTEAISFLKEGLLGLYDTFTFNTNGLTELNGVTEDAISVFNLFANTLSKLTNYDNKTLTLSEVLNDQNRSGIINSFVSDMETLSNAFWNFASLDDKEKVNLYESLANTFPDIVNGGNLTADMLQRVADAEWKQVETIFEGVEGAEDLLEALKNIYKGFYEKDANETPFERSVNRFLPEIKNYAVGINAANNRNIREDQGIKEFRALQDYTKKFNSFQKVIWITATNTAETIDDAIEAYEDVINSTSTLFPEFIPSTMEGFMSDENYSTFVNQYQGAIGIIEKGIKDVYSLSHSERMSLYQMFPWLTTEGISDTSLTFIRDEFDKTIEFLGQHVEGFSEYMKEIYEGSTETDKAILTDWKENWSGRGLDFGILKGSEGNNFIWFIPNTIKSMVLDVAKKNDISIKDAAKRYAENIPEYFESITEMLNNEIFSDLVSEYGEMLKVVSDGIDEEERKWFIETYGYVPSESEINMFLDALDTTIGLYTKAAGYAGENWYNEQKKIWEESIFDGKQIRDTLVDRINNLDIDFGDAKYGNLVEEDIKEWLNSLSNEDLAVALNINFDLYYGKGYGGNLKKVLNDELERLKKEIDTEGLLNFTIFDEKGQQATLSSYMDTVLSEAETVKGVINSLTLDGEHGGLKWEDIEKDFDLYTKLNQIIPGLSAHMKEYAGSNETTSEAISYLTEHLGTLYDTFLLNTAGLDDVEGVTDEARAAFEEFIRILASITQYDVRGELKDIGDRLDEIYFDRAGDQARSFEQAISDVESEIRTLHDAYTTLMNVNIKEDSEEFTSLVSTLIQQFPELIGHTDSIFELRDAVAALLNEKSDNIIIRLRELANEEGIPDELRGKIDALINSFYNLGNQPFSMDHTMNVLKDVRGELNQLAQFMNKVNETGLHLDMSGSDDVFNYFPQLLENAKIYSDGTVELNKEVYENFIKTREAELKGDIDAKIKELENNNVVLQSQIQYYEQRVKAAKTAIASESVADMEATLEKLDNADAVLQNAAENDAARVESYNEASRIIAEDESELVEYKINSDNAATENKQENDIAELESDDAKTIGEEENISDKNEFATEALNNEIESNANADTQILGMSADMSEGVQTNIGYIGDTATAVSEGSVNVMADGSDTAQTNSINASRKIQEALKWIGDKANLAAQAWRNIGTDNGAVDMGGVVFDGIINGANRLASGIANFSQRILNAKRGEIEKNAQMELKSFKDTFVGSALSSLGSTVGELIHSVDLEQIKAKTTEKKKLKENVGRDAELLFDRVLDVDGLVTDNTNRNTELEQQIKARLEEARERLQNSIDADSEILTELYEQLAKNNYNIELLKANGGIDLQDIANRLAADAAKDSGSDRSPSDKGGGSDRDATEQANEFADVIDWIEVKISRLEREISNLDKVAGNAFQKYTTRAKAIEKNIQNVHNELSAARAGYMRYLQEAESIPLSDYYKELVRKGAIDIETIQDEELSEAIKSYTEWYEKCLEMQDKLQDLCMQISDLYQEAFDLIQNRADSILSSFENASNLINSAISRTEQKGYLVSQKYYEKLIDNAETQMYILNKKHEEMLNMFQEAVDTGAVEEGSESWHNYKNQIDQVTIAIDSMTNSIIEYNNAIRQLQWDKFDLTQNMIGDITSEADFLISLMSNYKMYSTEGYITNRGIGTKGLHGLNYNVYMQQADEYRDEMLKITEDLAKDPNNQTLYERRKQLLELQREMILAAEQEKQALKSLVEQGIQSTLSYLRELIDTYSEALDQQKSLYDYQKNVANQTKNITNIQKQLAALSGDDSEENRKKLQELNISLESAQESLQETLYEKAISDQKELLNGLYDDFNTVLNERLDNLDVLIAEQIGEINLAAGQINDTINTVAGNVGYQVTSGVSEVFASSDFNSLPALATYTSELMNELSNDRAIITETLTNGQTSTLENITEHAGVIEGYLTAVAAALGYEGQTAASLIGDSVYGIQLNAEKIDNIANLLGTGEGNLSDNIHNAFSEDLSVINSALSGEQSIQNLIETMASTLQKALIGGEYSVSTSIQNVGDALETYLGGGDTNAIKRSFDDNSTAIQDQIQGVKNKIAEMDKASQVIAAIDLNTGKVGDVINNMGSVTTDLAKIREMLEKLFNTKATTPESSNVKASSGSAAANGAGTYTKTGTNLPNTTTSTGSNSGTGASTAVNNAKGITQGNGKPEVGDIVTYTGSYYFSAWQVTPVGSYFSGQPNAVEIDRDVSNYSGVSKPYHIKKAGSKPGEPWSDMGWVSIDQLKGYWTGTQSVDKDRFALVNERGLETIVRPDGSILTPLARQSMVVDAQATDNMWRMLKDPEKFMSTVLKDTNIVNTNNTGDINNDISITIPISNVSDFEDLMRQIQSSDKWERMFDAMLNNRLKGTSRFDKYNVRF